LTLINDILDLSKIEAGQIEINPEDVEIAELVHSMRRTFDPVAADRKLEFHTAVATNVPPSIYTDNQRVQQVLKNLLSNAFKFTPRGDVTLQVSLRDGGRIAFAVRDSGIGIAPRQQEVIFEAFRQADGTTSRQYGGTGLGLSISRELASRLGGSIQLQSSPGMGSTFTLDLPLVLEKATPRGEQRPAPAEPPQAAPVTRPAPK